MIDRRERKPLRLAGWDYTSHAAYFVTICAYRRHLSFEASETAAVIQHAWNEIPAHFRGVSLDAFVIMPNHIHGIVVIGQDAQFVGARYISPLRTRAPGTPTRSLGAIIGTFKAAVTRDLRWRELWGDSPFWQRNYYERIIRDDDDLDRIREYIVNNPLAWLHDLDNPTHTVNEEHRRAWAWLESQT